MTVMIHTSPVKISNIQKSFGVFDDVLFFSNNGYVHTASNTVYTYIIKTDDDDIITARELKQFYDTESFKEAQEKLIRDWDIDSDTAHDLIADYTDACDITSEISSNDTFLAWDVQKLQAKIALANGFKFVQLKDENGVVWASAMYNRESELQLVDNDFDERDLC